MQRKSGLVVERCALRSKRKTCLIGFLRGSERASPFIESREIDPHLSSARRNQYHPLGDLQTPRALSQLKYADLEIAFQAQQHIDVADRFRKPGIIGLGRTHTRRRAERLPVERYAAVERI